MLYGPSLLFFWIENIEKLVFMYSIPPNYTLRLDLTVVIMLYVFFSSFKSYPICI